MRFMPVMHAFTSGKRTSQTDFATKETKELATEEVEVPFDLAQRIFELADLTDRQTKLAREHGLKAAESGLFRASPPPRVR